MIIKMIVETGKAGDVWGRCDVSGNLVVDCCWTIEDLKESMKELILSEYGIQVDDFEIEKEKLNA